MSNKSSKKIAKTKLKEEKPIKKVMLRFFIYALLIGGCLYLTNDKEVFSPVRKISEAFTVKRWEYYYKFTKKQDPDILFFGNSLVIHGINPQNFSTALGCNSFILAGPGTYYHDQFYSFKEAIKVKKPKMVIFETFGLKKMNSGRDRSAMFKSFAARKDIPTKIASTPFLANLNDYVNLWSNTVRNHSNLYDYDSIPIGDFNKIKEIRASNELYLGRYICFTQGIDSANYAKIKSDSAYYDTSIEVDANLQSYIESIVNLCREENIQLMFLTIPMFDEGLRNTTERDSVLANLLKGQNWLNLQDTTNYNGFGRESFQNCSNCVTHMTYKGSLTATYKLVDYILNDTSIILPNRKSDNVWQQIFYEKDGFFENNLIPVDDKKNKNLLQGKADDLISNVIQVSLKDYDKIIAKIKPNKEYTFDELKNKKLQLLIQANYEGKLQTFNIQLDYDPYHSHSKNVIFNMSIKKMEIKSVQKAAFIQI